MTTIIPLVSKPKAKRKRPKVRYVARGYDVIDITKKSRTLLIVAGSYNPIHAKRIAAALNWHTAFRKGEL